MKLVRQKRKIEMLLMELYMPLMEGMDGIFDRAKSIKRGKVLVKAHIRQGS